MGQPPSAPPCDEENYPIPVVTATAFDVSAAPAAKVVTTTYEDGRQVTVTEFQQPGSSAGTAPAAAPAPAAIPAPSPSQGAKICERGILRRDLGARPVMVKCGHCNHTGITKANSSLGACTFISAFALIFLFLPLFWLPFVCPSVSALNFHQLKYF